jgi:hypothetical protein
MHVTGLLVHAHPMPVFQQTGRSRQATNTRPYQCNIHGVIRKKNVHAIDPV